MERKAVVNIITLRTSGDYPWWDKFPLNIAEKSQRLGIDYFFSFRDFSKHSLIPKDKRIILRHSEAQSPFKVYHRFKNLLKNYDKVIFHNHSGHGNNGLFVFNHRFNKKSHWITTDHDSWLFNKFSFTKRQIRKILRSLGFLPEIIIGCSKASERRLKEIYGDRNTTYIYNGAGVTKEHTISTKREINKGIFVGRLEFYKGVMAMLKAMKLLKDKGVNFTLSVLGSGPARKEMERYVKENGLEQMVKFLGHVHNVAQFLSECGLAFILSEWNENFPVSSIEYQAAGLPCIYTNSGGLPESQIKSKTGIMVKKDDTSAVADAVEFMLNNFDKWEEMSKNAYENAKRFSLDRMANNYILLYEKIFNHWNNIDKAIDLFKKERL